MPKIKCGNVYNYANKIVEHYINYWARKYIDGYEAVPDWDAAQKEVVFVQEQMKPLLITATFVGFIPENIIELSPVQGFVSRLEFSRDMSFAKLLEYLSFRMDDYVRRELGINEDLDELRHRAILEGRIVKKTDPTIYSELARKVVEAVTKDPELIVTEQDLQQQKPAKEKLIKAFMKIAEPDMTDLVRMAIVQEDNITIDPIFGIDREAGYKVVIRLTPTTICPHKAMLQGAISDVAEAILPESTEVYVGAVSRTNLAKHHIFLRPNEWKSIEDLAEALLKNPNPAECFKKNMKTIIFGGVILGQKQGTPGARKIVRLEVPGAAP